jgi:hypothetical protein
MAIYDEFKKIEEIVNCDNFNKDLDDLMVYIRMVNENNDVTQNNVFDWMALLDSNEYDEYELDEDIRHSGNFDEDDVNEIKKRLDSLLSKLNGCLQSFEEKTGLWIYFQYNDDEYEAYFDFNASKVLNAVVELYKIKTEA